MTYLCHLNYESRFTPGDMMSFDLPREPYALFVHLGHQFAHSEDRLSQSKMSKLFGSVMEAADKSSGLHSEMHHQSFEISDSRISSAAQHLNGLVTHLLQDQQAPQSHLLESIAFGANCLEIVRDLQKQLKTQEVMPDTAIAQLETNLVSLSEKWLHYLIENPQQFFSILSNPVTFNLAISFLEQKWNNLSQFLGSLIPPTVMPSWPPSEEALQCLSDFQKYQTMSQEKAKALTDRLNSTQEIFEWSTREGRIDPARMVQIRAEIERYKGLLSIPTWMNGDTIRTLCT